jgi:competence protein ComEA
VSERTDQRQVDPAAELGRFEGSGRADPIDLLTSVATRPSSRLGDLWSSLAVTGPVRIAAGVGAMVVLVWLATGWLSGSSADPEASLPLEVGATGPSSSELVVGGPGAPPAVEAQTRDEGETDPEVLVVHVAGAVTAPGVYELPAGSRVADAVELAGGPTAVADVGSINLAAPLTDGGRLYVPLPGEIVPTVRGGLGGSGDDAAGTGGGSADTVDVNTADEQSLEALPGVGPATAAAIIEHRERSGPFSVPEDLLDVRGIGPAKLEAMRDHLAL